MDSRRLIGRFTLLRMYDFEIGKRVTAIGLELAALAKKKLEVDEKVRSLMAEAHAMTKPDNSDPLKGPSPIRDPSVRLIRKGAPSAQSVVLRLLGKSGPRTKYQIAQALTMPATKVQYCLSGLRRCGRAASMGNGVWGLTETGQQTFREISNGHTVSDDGSTIDVPGEEVNDSANAATAAQ